MASKFRYFEFLLEEFSDITPIMRRIREDMIRDEDSIKLIMNILLDTEIFAYVKNLQDHPAQRYTEFDTVLDVVQLDKDLQKNVSFIRTAEIRSYAKSHYNPIWRVAAFVAEFILQANERYLKRA